MKGYFHREEGGGLKGRAGRGSQKKKQTPLGSNWKGFLSLHFSNTLIEIQAAFGWPSAEE